MRSAPVTLLCQNCKKPEDHYVLPRLGEPAYFTCATPSPAAPTREPEYLQRSEFGGFDHGHLFDAYMAGAKDGRANPMCGDHLIQRSADAYVKSVAPTTGHSKRFWLGYEFRRIGEAFVQLANHYERCGDQHICGSHSDHIAEAHKWASYCFENAESLNNA